MNVNLRHTNSSRINDALLDARRHHGSPTMARLGTLIMVAPGDTACLAVELVERVAGERPSRILVVARQPDAETRLDAGVRVSDGYGHVEIVSLYLHGEVAQHADSVVLPLLAPESPVVVYWLGQPPLVPARDPLGAMAQRRITDLAASPSPLTDLSERACHYVTGDTDLSWTRITPWRSTLAAALDQTGAEPVHGLVAGEPDSPSSELLALWLEDRLGIDVDRSIAPGPGVTEARVTTTDGDISLVRHDEQHAALTAPKGPARLVDLKRRDLSELLAEELRNLGPDDVYAATLTRVARLGT